MKTKAIIRLTKAQRQRIFDCGVGVGVVAYKMADDQLSEFEFYLDRKNQMRFVGNGAPVRFEVERDEDGFETCAKVVEYDTEMQARADILNRAVEHRQRLFPDDVGNGWIDSIDRLAHEIPTLRGQLAAKERELEVARLAHKATDKDRQQALDLLDKAGVWTGADLLVNDRVASLIRDWQEQQRKIVALQAEVGHLKNELASK